VRAMLVFAMIVCASGAIQAQDARLAAAGSQENIPSDLKMLLQSIQTPADTTIASQEGKDLAAELESLRIADTYESRSGCP